MENVWLAAAGIADGLAAMGHLGCILGGPAWYRFFGAGQRMEREAAAGLLRPTLITLAIAIVLASWCVYAIAAAIGNPLPMSRWILGAITAVYLTRGLAGFQLQRLGLGRSKAFWIWSSVVCLVFAALHGVGLITGWQALASRAG